MRLKGVVVVEVMDRERSDTVGSATELLAVDLEEAEQRFLES